MSEAIVLYSFHQNTLTDDSFHPPPRSAATLIDGLYRQICVCLSAMAITTTGFSQNFEIHNLTDEDFTVLVYVWFYPPCPGDAENDVLTVCAYANDVTYIVAPPEKFIKQTKISCGCDTDDWVGSTHCLGTGDPFECGSTWYVAGNSERGMRIEYY
ncbi:MAG: hypothetical protein ACK4L7_09530 [Flavobacteriales bacterium]